MAGEAASELQDWELLHDSEPILLNPINLSEGSDSESDFVKSPNLFGDVRSFEAIRSDYFSLDGQNRYAKASDVETDGSQEGSVESDNPSWIEPGSETRYERKLSGEFWSDSASDRSDERKLSENELGLVEEATSQAGLEGPGEMDTKTENFGEFYVFEAKIEVGSGENAKGEVGFEGFGEIPIKDKDLGNFWSDSGGDGLVPIKFGDHANASEEGSEMFGESDVGDGLMAASEGGNDNSGVPIDEMKENEKSGGELKKRNVVWWKVPFELLKYCVLRVNPVWTFSMAAAVMGFVILGRRLYKMKRKSRSLEIKVTMDDKKVSQFMTRAARLNEAFSVVRRVPMLRPTMPAAGVNPWPAMILR
ncbi:hypothetical protein HS088_TW10G00953 [Tripterygium wilfordii]|uniref:DUF6821 domain-containing protein n=1 Tax=Tripterygium wilfordii TaxID=458696 RepID=A0A7J7D6F9_TRIWF|nr:uncharacterized protein LOC120007853 [Tripterygium wilfordii]KAF5741945.1 hypothetical protein HS088_TW10G00953 [Tripterygium wilfordii]